MDPEEKKTKLLPIYKAKHLDKINSQRVALSETKVENLTPTRGQALFSPASDNLNQPRSCYSCRFYKSAESRCSILPASITIRKITYGEEFKTIEYWPVCGMWTPVGKPLDPDFVELSWINAPTVGGAAGGSNCGGINNGDDCDFYEVDNNVYSDKRDAPFGTCKFLKTMVYNGDCCSLWNDDDVLDWQKAQDILNEKK